ncbi:MAG: UvrD-helicase domain-containing protein [Bacteroidetes bacterium]|nr:UvrD-helicase domain-containing protein [Rhodothermia bacterium]MCS7155157.1 UvrD-helicase domain-containing protein [Bacteroidota bacterium]MCX7906216.1 UvrD-helicase domain-containing protein [Bacteroidota bacterium]MDW8138343.1 UvrD-helicase domain-containing protein [Bacteroidota bacterium]MDW8286028.1 UvrD-helicase domain-containing protein [Bacteroidota bacterium]
MSEFRFVSASAGSGKTHRLTGRLLWLLLDPRVPYGDIAHVLAITFTNNAARQLRRRLLEWLKRVAGGDAAWLRALQEAFPPQGAPEWTQQEWRDRARALLEALLDRYGELQVGTIDSFLGRLLRATALEFGLNPGLELALDPRPLLREALRGYLEQALRSRTEARTLEHVLRLMEETRTRYPWSPQAELERELIRIHERLAGLLEKPLAIAPEGSAEALRGELRALAEAIAQRLAFWSERGVAAAQNFEKLVRALKTGDLEALLKREPAQRAFKKGPRSEEAEVDMAPLQERLGELRRLYARFLAAARYAPYVTLYGQLRRRMRELERTQDRLHLAEATALLLQLLRQEVIPDIYFRLGDRISHYLIDEFQDTAPIQWAALRPLIEEALARGGSLFLVGDTKQAIYGFRGGDWQIMAHMRQHDVFPSAPTQREELTVNYRSDGWIVRFVEQVFEEAAARRVQALASENPFLPLYWEASGLHRAAQQVRVGREKAGYVRFRRFAVPKRADAEVFEPEAEGAALPSRELLRTLQDLRARGYGWSQIAVLAPRNQDVLELGAWLARAEIPFVSHSSLDVRQRPVVRALLALLEFLDSPIKDLAFASVLLGPLRPPELELEQVRAFLREHRQTSPLYTAFRERYPELWARYFERPFSRVGYLPVYELLVELYQSWGVLGRHAEETATWAKLLEVVRRFEEDGQGSLRDFLERASEVSEDEDWDVPVAEGLEAVTLMSVHKAKGLEFPAVLLYWPDLPPPADPQYPGSIPSDPDSGIRLWYLSADVANADPALKDVYLHRRATATIDSLCRLYVALTRAGSELHVFWLEAGGDLGRFLPAEDLELGAPTGPSAPAQLALGGAQFTPWPPPRSLDLPKRPLTADRREAERGECWHAVLARIRFLTADPVAQLERALEEVLSQHPEWACWREEARRSLLRFLERPQVQGHFRWRPNRIVYTELELLDAQGRLHRIDRLVCDPECIWVLDFKTGAPRPEDAAQIAEYARWVRALWPDRPIRTSLLYVEP